jgi:hypothetical protein
MLSKFDCISVIRTKPDFIKAKFTAVKASKTIIFEDKTKNDFEDDDLSKYSISGDITIECKDREHFKSGEQYYVDFALVNLGQRKI